MGHTLLYENLNDNNCISLVSRCWSSLRRFGGLYPLASILLTIVLFRKERVYPHPGLGRIRNKFIPIFFKKTNMRSITINSETFILSIYTHHVGAYEIMGDNKNSKKYIKLVIIASDYKCTVVKILSTCSSIFFVFVL